MLTIRTLLNLFIRTSPIPREAEDKPSLIPFDVIESGEINWGNSSIKGNGLEFVGVAVLEKQLIDESNEKSNSTENDKEPFGKSIRGKGRPSLNPLIKEIYLEEKRNRRIDYSKSKKAIFNELEITIAEKLDIRVDPQTKHYKGLGYTAINNAIGRLVDKERDKLSS